MKPPAWFQDLRYCARHPLARAGLWASAVALIVLAVALVFWWPTQNAHQDLTDDIAAKRRELVQAQQADELLRLYARAQADAPLLEKKLEQAVSQAQLVENLARLARRRGVRIVSETYEEGKGGEAHKSLVAELTVQGRYLALRDFLGDLPTLPTWSEVQEVRFEAARGLGEIKGRIRVVTYRRLSGGDPRRS